MDSLHSTNTSIQMYMFQTTHPECCHKMNVSIKKHWGLAVCISIVLYGPCVELCQWSYSPNSKCCDEVLLNDMVHHTKQDYPILADDLTISPEPWKTVNCGWLRSYISPSPDSLAELCQSINAQLTQITWKTPPQQGWQCEGGW